MRNSWNTGKFFLYAVLCKVTDSPSQRRNLFKPVGLWHPGTASWHKTGNKNKGSPSTSKLIFDMPSFENKIMSSSSAAWSVLPDRNRLLTSYPMGSANSSRLEWRLMDMQGDEWQFSRKVVCDFTHLLAAYHLSWWYLEVSLAGVPYTHSFEILKKNS